MGNKPYIVVATVIVIRELADAVVRARFEHILLVLKSQPLNEVLVLHI